MRRFVWHLIAVILIITLAFSLSGCEKDQVSKSTSRPKNIIKDVAATKDWKLVKSQDKKLTLKVPQDWQVKTADELALGPGKYFAIYAPEGEDSYPSNIQVSKETAEGATLSVYIDQFEINSKKDDGIKVLKVIEEGEVDSNLGQVYRKKYDYQLEASNQTYDLIFDALYIRTGDDYYVVQMVASKNLFEEVESTFNKTLGTLNIK